MKKTENECVCCGLPCLGGSCPHARVTRYYCDKCGKETEIYEFQFEELCEDCIFEMLPEDEKEDFDISELDCINDKEEDY